MPDEKNKATAVPPPNGDNAVSRRAGRTSGEVSARLRAREIEVQHLSAKLHERNWEKYWAEAEREDR